MKIPLNDNRTDEQLKTRTLQGVVLNIDGITGHGDILSQIRHWRSHGIKCAVVSSDKNCRRNLETAGIRDLLDVCIDSVTLYEKGLKSCPAPDLLLEAATELGIQPGNCVIIEDTVAGVQAGSRGNFSLVIGIDRTDNRKALYENGADIVVDDMRQIDLFSETTAQYFTEFAPSLFSRLSEFNTLIKNKKPALFLDYDGTLTPIVKNPQDALLSDEMREMIRRYNSISPLAIVSGRDMDDLKRMARIEGIIYAGSHGFRVSGPDGLYMEHAKSGDILPELDRIEKKLKGTLGEKIRGLNIERKRYAIAIHYRNVATKDVPSVFEAAQTIIDKNPGFRKGEGKKVVEIRPDIDWHKGKAMKWIIDKVYPTSRQDVIPIYLGDDITDEDVFETITDTGIGILVGFHGRRTKARYSLKNVYQVKVFMEMLMNKIREQ
jgi:trehalose 6-phosphate phosphatase